MSEWKKFGWLAGIFLVAYFLPLGNPKVREAIFEAFYLLQWYAINHTLACVVPAMFIAGAISTFLSQASVMRYLGPKSNRTVAYTVASVSGVILAVCSCSVLPMFAGIYSLGAGLGPASAFLYSGPAINVMAIFLSARVLGVDLGVARAIGAIAFAFVIGLLMAFIFRRSEQKRTEAAMQLPEPPAGTRSLGQTSLYFLCLVLLLVFSDWYNTNDVTITMKNGTVVQANIRYQTQANFDIQRYGEDGRLVIAFERILRSDVAKMEQAPSFTMTVHGMKWYLAGLMGLAVLVMLWRWFSREEIKQWLESTWDFGKMIVPLLFGGVFLTGFVGALLPESYVATLVGGNSLLSNFIASFVGMIWYFATLTEIPIVEMLMKLGMGKGPALALLLAGPALSLPSILVIWKIIGAKKTFVFCLLAVVMSTVVGFIFGMFVS
jgi:uncharacterized membrane protein YraQ (UPF0718 family)